MLAVAAAAANALAGTTPASAAASGSAAPATGDIRAAGAPSAIAGSYLVMLKADASTSLSRTHGHRHPRDPHGLRLPGDIFAPDDGILSAWSGDTATNTISGTSMATPHVTGTAALVLSRNPFYSPSQVASAIVGNATTGVLAGIGSGSPSRLLFVS